MLESLLDVAQPQLTILQDLSAVDVTSRQSQVKCIQKLIQGCYASFIHLQMKTASEIIVMYIIGDICYMLNDS